MTNKKELSLFKLTWPIFLELFLFMLMGLVDTFMLSSVSDEAVAGVGAANQYVQIAILILGVIGTGASIVISQYIGSHRLLDVTKLSALSVTLNLFVGVVVSVIFIIFSGKILSAMNLEGDVLTAATTYLKIVGGTIFFQAVITSASAIIRVQGLTKQTMYLAAGMNFLNALFNYLFIFGKLGFPEMGVAGAGISSVISRAVAAVVFFWLLYRSLEIKIEYRYFYTFSKNYVREIMKIGIPSAVEQILYQACQLVFLYYVTYLGATSLAARQYAVNISMFTYLFALAIGMGTAILIGRNVGAGEKDIAYHRAWSSVKTAMLLTIPAVVIITIFREPFMRLFTTNEEVVAIGASVLLLGIVLETGRAINLTFINALRAAGDARYPVRVGFFTMVCVSLSLGYLFVFVMDMGLIGVWLAIAADEWLRAILVVLRWRSRKWERYSIISSSK